MHLKHLQELTNLNEAAGGFFTEAKGYSDSSEFTAEFYGELFTQVTKMKKVMKDPKWVDYMKMADFTNDTHTEGHARTAIRAIIALEAALQAIDKEFDRANGHNDDAGDDLPNDGLDDITDDGGSRER